MVNGGRKTINYDFKIYNTIGVEEQKSVLKVLKTGKLSPFLGDWGNIPNIGSFYGGQKVKFFENKIQKYFGVKAPSKGYWFLSSIDQALHYFTYYLIVLLIA